jgi:dsDNA-specific endonuclease/ATPase MutS2
LSRVPPREPELEPDPEPDREPDAERVGDAAPDANAPLHVPLADALDLHTFHPRDVRAVVEEYLWEAARAGLSEVRIIHGKGLGVQRRIVTGVLERHAAVASFHTAPADRGHYGATIVRLRHAPEREARA